MDRPEGSDPSATGLRACGHRGICRHDRLPALRRLCRPHDRQYHPARHRAGERASPPRRVLWHDHRRVPGGRAAVARPAAARRRAMAGADAHRRAARRLQFCRQVLGGAAAGARHGHAERGRHKVRRRQPQHRLHHRQFAEARRGAGRLAVDAPRAIGGGVGRRRHLRAGVAELCARRRSGRARPRLPRLSAAGARGGAALCLRARAAAGAPLNQERPAGGRLSMPQAVLCRKLGAPEDLALEEVAPAPLGPGQLRIAIHAAGINFPDLLMVAGLYQHKPALPFIPGLEAAGTVSEVGDGADGAFAPGDKVMVALRQGGYAEEVVVAPEQAMPLPAGFSFAEGATFRTAYGTAHHALVGLAAVEIGKLLGATVIAAASREAKLAVARARGADHLILYGREPLRDAVKRITAGAGADIVFDPVGGAVFEESLRSIAWGARMLVIGFTGGIGMARTNLVLLKGASVIGVRAGEAGRRDPALRARLSAALTGLTAAGHLRPHISHALPLARWAEAMRLVAERQAIGRVALLVRGA